MSIESAPSQLADFTASLKRHHGLLKGWCAACKGQGLQALSASWPTKAMGAVLRPEDLRRTRLFDSKYSRFKPLAFRCEFCRFRTKNLDMTSISFRTTVTGSSNF